MQTHENTDNGGHGIRAGDLLKSGILNTGHTAESPWGAFESTNAQALPSRIMI